jgi:hypothetical protein
MKFLRKILYQFSYAAAGWIPRPLLRHLLRLLHVRPDLTDRVGYQVYPQVFYSPFPEPAQVDLERLKLKRPLPGVKFNPQFTTSLLADLARYATELSDFFKNRPAHLVHWDMTYPPLDTATLYAMLRHLKPKRYIEVGCGYSSRVSVAALGRNHEEGSTCQALYIEPYPPAYLTELKLPGEFIQRKVQEVPLEKFKSLEAGDVLFIDTSHVIKTQNDVEFELLQILPSLKPGVFVHIHDILTPYDYPVEWLLGHSPNRGGNNEQYALECLLSGGNDWEVVLPVFLLWKEQRQSLTPLLNSDARPAAFWIRRI